MGLNGQLTVLGDTFKYTKNTTGIIQIENHHLSGITNAKHNSYR